MQIDNSYTVNQCPFCRCEDIYFVGNITYSDPLFFAETKIELTYQPQLWECRACNSKFTQNAIPEDEATMLYTQSTNRWDYQLPFEDYHTARVVNTLKQVCKPGMKILDIGCSNGFLLDFAKRSGCITYGIEFSDLRRDTCNKNGHRCFKNIQELPVSIQFDRIFCFDIIEHIYSPDTFLDSYMNYLKADGIFCIVTGNIGGRASKKYGSGWWYVQYPEHIRFPSLQYFSKFIISGCQDCYASKNHEGRILLKLITILKRKVQGNSNGTPSLTEDHLCLLLKKTGVKKQ